LPAGCVDRPLGEETKPEERDQHDVRRNLGDDVFHREPLTSIDSVLTLKKPNGEHSTDESGAGEPRKSGPNEQLAARCWCRTGW
jgi:hypothetical protein